MSALRASGAAIALSSAAWLSAIYSIPGDHTGRVLVAAALIYVGCRLALLRGDR